MKRIGVIGIIVENQRESAIEIQKLLSEFSDIIIGRMGVPDKEDDISAISVIVRGSNERISSLSGKLGKLENIYVKSALTSKEVKGE
jgi:putative iron-only hydrogenase system regulator